MMSIDQLIVAIRKRAMDEATRTDLLVMGSLQPTVGEALIRETETLLGFELPMLLRRIYLEIGNGGCGPGYGLIGLRGGHVDSDGRTLDEAYDHIKEDVESHLGNSRREFLPLCEWGAGIWSCLDCGSNALPILTLD